MPEHLRNSLFAIPAAAAIWIIFAVASAQGTNWHICQPDERRHTCVVDGDTLWYEGTKIRLIGIDAPEVQGRCANEHELARQATVYRIELR